MPISDFGEIYQFFSLNCKLETKYLILVKFTMLQFFAWLIFLLDFFFTELDFHSSLLENRFLSILVTWIFYQMSTSWPTVYLSHKLGHFGIIILAFWLFALGYRPNFWILKIHPNNKPNILVKKKTPES